MPEYGTSATSCLESTAATFPLSGANAIVAPAGQDATTCAAVTTPLVNMNPVPTKPGAAVGLTQVTGITDFSALAVTLSGTGVAVAVTAEAAAVKGGTGLVTITVLV
jgi:hypothetical protein